jgi:hypothetical protein
MFSVQAMNKEKSRKETKMKLRERVLIFMAAVLITLVGFSLISSPAVDMVKVGKEAGYEIITNWLAKADAAHHQPKIRKA